jgi:hypothetical protein
MGLFDFFKKQSEAAALPSEHFKQAALRASAQQQELANSGCDADEIPNAQGRFGYDETNPIPVHLPAGRNDYLRRLKLSSGEGIQSTRTGSKSMPGIEDQQGMIDIIEVQTLSGQPIATLYFSVYHRRNSLKAPDGFVLHT